jgi:tRNA nucleotidyltransferase/poly(A) polymerase
MATLAFNGFEAYAVGGWVRDLILHRQPKDYDVLTNALPDQVEALFPKTLAIGKKFGIVVVVMNGIPTEVATYRIDGQYKDGRRPEDVTFASTADDDVKRRDFTINGMLMRSFTGSVRDDIIDYVGGKDDLAAKRIRTIGNAGKRFQEDALRMLRAIRFATVLGFEIHCDTWDAIQRNRHLIKEISGERIRDEILKILTAQDSARGLGLLASSGLLLTLFPEFSRINFALMVQRFGFSPTSDETEALAMFVADLPTKDCNAALHAFRLPLNQAVLALRASREFRDLRDSNHWTRHEVIQFAQQPHAWLALNLFEMDFGLDDRFPRELVEQITTMFRNLKHDEIFPPALINGADLIAAGYTPSSEFGVMLSLVETLQLDRQLTDKAGALSWLLLHFPPEQGGQV